MISKHPICSLYEFDPKHWMTVCFCLSLIRRRVSSVVPALSHGAAETRCRGHGERTPTTQRRNGARGAPKRHQKQPR